MWLKRPHNITIGGDVRRIQLNLISQQDARGSFGFTGAATQATANGVGVPGTGSDFADFLLGTPDTSSIAFGNADKYFRSTSLRCLFHGRLAGERGLHAERGRALGVLEPDRGKVRAAGEPGYRAELWAGGAGAGQQSHGLADRDAVSEFAGASGQARDTAARRDFLAADLRLIAADSRGLRGDLQHVGLQHDRDADGAAIAALEEPECRQQSAQSADAGQRVQR